LRTKRVTHFDRPRRGPGRLAGKHRSSRYQVRDPAVSRWPGCSASTPDINTTERTRLLYRIKIHRKRKGERNSFAETDYANLLDAAHQYPKTDLVVIWDNLNTHISAAMPSDKVISRALGEELRRTREACGWSRMQLVSRLPSGIGDRTLLSYEHGARHLTLLRLIEICRAMGVDSAMLRSRALQRARIHMETMNFQVDLRELLRDCNTNSKFRPMIQWARNTLNEDPEGIVEVQPAAALGTDDPQEVDEVAAALEALARRLHPDMLTRLRAGRTAP
jgi:hypothetical protein